MILVAGGTGFVGGGIVRELASRDKPVAVLTRNAAKAATRFPHIQVEYREGDVRDPASLAAAVQGAEVVIGCVQFPNSPGSQGGGRPALHLPERRWRRPRCQISLVSGKVAGRDGCQG